MTQKKKEKKIVGSDGRNGHPERLMLVLDNSPSMELADWEPSRLAGAIEASEALMAVKAKKYPNDRVGIVGFNRRARTICPPMVVSRGIEDLKDGLGRMNTKSFTNITAGLAEAGRHLVDDEKLGVVRKTAGMLGRLSKKLISGKVPSPVDPPPDGREILRIVLLSDGAHNKGTSPVFLADKLKEAGVVIDCIGIGADLEDFDMECLEKISSKNGDGSPRCSYIGNKSGLVKKFKDLSSRIQWA